MRYQGRLRQPLQYMGAEAASREPTADKGRIKALPYKTRTQMCLQVKKRPGTRVFEAGKMGEQGFALVYAVVLFGVLAIILSSAVSQEGSAQALNIRTGQRRKALDLARGVVDEMLGALFKNGFDVSNCPPIMQGDESQNWSATATAGKDSYGFIWVMGEATVAGVSETVKVKLEPYSLLDLYSDGVFVAGHGLDAEFKNKAEGLAAHGNIYVGDKWSAEGNGGKVSIYGEVYEGYPVVIPKPQDVKRHVEAIINPMLASDIWYELDGKEKNIVIEEGTHVRAGNIPSLDNLVVRPDAWLHVQGDLTASGHSEVQIDGVAIIDGDFKVSGNAGIRIDGVLIVRRGEIKINPNDNVPISGSGTIISLSEKDQKFRIALGEGERSGLCLVSAGKLELTISDTSKSRNSLFVYAREIEAEFKKSGDVTIDPCRFISVEDTRIEFGNNVGKAELYAGGFDWQEHPSFLGGSYRIVSWSEGKVR